MLLFAAKPAMIPHYRPADAQIIARDAAARAPLIRLHVSGRRRTHQVNLAQRLSGHAAPLTLHTDCVLMTS